MEQQIFPFLLANGITPIVISGAPQEQVELFKKRIPFKNVYGLQYEIEDEKYTDNYNINTAIADGKTKIIQKFMKENPEAEIIFGFGDSEADIPILKSARQGFVNNSTKFFERDNIHYLDFEAEQAGEQIIGLMTQELAKLDINKQTV